MSILAVLGATKQVARTSVFEVRGSALVIALPVSYSRPMPRLRRPFLSAVMGLMNTRLVARALTCAFILAGGMQRINAGDSPNAETTEVLSPASCAAARAAASPGERSMAIADPGSAPDLDPEGDRSETSRGGDVVLALCRETAAPSPDNGPATPAVHTGAPASPPEPGWTPAAYINSRLPHWLHLNGELRNRDEAPTAYSFRPGNNDAYALTRAVLGFDAAPTSWLHAFVQARDAEVIGANPKNVTGSMKDAFDLEQAYIEFRNADQGWISLQAGRQQMYYGDERLIGRSDWSNASRSFDGARLRLRSQTYAARLDIFASSVVKNYPTSLDRVLPGQNFYGIDLALSKLAPYATIDPYLYVKTLPSVTGVDKLTGNERLYTSGFRMNGTFAGGFDYRGRFSLQSGHRADDPVHAGGGYAVLGYTIPKSRFQPRFAMEYAYASGNKTLDDRVMGTFDQLYPSTHNQRGLTDLFAEENMVDLKPAFDFRPVKKTKVFFVVNDLSLASKYDGLYDPRSEALIVKAPQGGALSSDVGTEADVYGTYDINPRLQLGAGIGHLYAGRFLKENSSGGSVTYPYVMMDYHF